MPACDSERHVSFSLLFGSVSLGALTLLFIAIVFLYKWQTEFDDAYKRKSVPRMSAVLLFFLVLERIGRIWETYSMYFSSKMSYHISYHTTTVVGLGGVFTALFLTLSVKLIASFEQSTFRLSNRDKIVLYSLTAGAVTSIVLFWTLHQFSFFYRNLIGLYLQPSIALIGLVLGLTLLGKVTFGFASRLRSLVVTEACIQADEMNHSPVPRSPSSNGRAGSPRMFQNMDEKALSRRASVAAIRRSSISFYESGQKRLLAKAATSLNVSVWLTVSFVLSFVSGIFFAMNGRCPRWPMIVGNSLSSLAFSVMGIAVCLSVQGFEKQYRLLCRSFDHCIQKMIAFQTTRQVLELSEIPDSPGSPEI